LLIRMREKELVIMEEIMSEKIIQWRKWLQIIIVFLLDVINYK
jgi:hypothetical protein